jgi:hypothetical protein
MLKDHNRLDLMLSTAEYTDAACGSLNMRTAEPAYCGADCPVLLGAEARPLISEIHKRMAGLPHDERVAIRQSFGKSV